MIFGLIIGLGTFILNLLKTILIVIDLAVPTQVGIAMTWFFSKIHIFNGIFPIDTAILCLLFLLSVWTGKYMIKIGLWIISFIPFIKYQELPHMSESRSESTSRDQFGNVRTTTSTSTTKKKGYFRR